MTALVVIDDHSQLLSKGDLKHSEIDQIILEGTNPTDREMSVASCVLPNIFLKDNTFKSDVAVAGDVVVDGNVTIKGETTNLEVKTLTIEDVVIYLGQGSDSPAAAGDRGLVFAVDGSDNLSFYWDNDKTEFRLAKISEMAGPDEFPDSVTYQTMRVGDIFSEGNVLSSGDINVGGSIEVENTIKAKDLEVSGDLSISSLTLDDITVNTLATVNEVTASGNITTAGSITANFMTTQNFEAADVCVNGPVLSELLNVSGNAFIGGDLHITSLLVSGGQPFFVQGKGIVLEPIPETGQIRITSPIGDKKKFFTNIEEHISAETEITIPGLDPEYYFYDDDFWDVFVNGVLQVPGSDNDFIVDSDLNIIFSFDLEEMDVIVISVMR